MSRRIRTWGAGLVVAATLVAAAPGAYCSVMNGASVERHGKTVEMHFQFRGRGLRWRVQSQGQELRLDLYHTRIEMPARPLFGHEIPPVKLVRALGSGGRGELLIEVSGKTDYAIGQLPDQLVVRLAPAGSAPDLAAPILVRRERPAPSPGMAMASASGASTSRPAKLTGYSAPVRELRADTPPASTQVDYSPPPTAAYRAHTAPARQPDHTDSAAAMVQPRAPHPLVMIDPGHGGYDPGTEVNAHWQEKSLAFDISTRLQKELEQRGIAAKLTRNGDYFVSLPERTRAANLARADLFISIHLNSSPDAQTTGIETYYLNNTTDRATIRLARMENAAGGDYSAPAEPNLNYILTDMRQQYKANDAASLARMIEAQTAADLDASLGLSVNALGAKRGPFYVLVGARMPAVLVECGFLSNPGEARLLASAQYQEVLAQGIAEAVLHYFRADAAVGNL